MRLCYVLHQFPELSQTFVFRQIIDLLEQGHRVDVIAARPGEGAEQHVAWTRQASRLGLDTFYTGMPEGLVRRALAGSLLVLPAALRWPRLASAALDIRRFGWFAATGSLLTMGLPLAGRPRRYDAIVAHFGPQGVIAQGLREMRLLEGPLVTFFHAYDLTSAPRLAGRSMYRRLFERGDLLLAISERGAEQLRALGAPVEKTRVHHMGVNVATFHPPEAPRDRGSAARTRVISIGRLIAKKSFHLGLEAVAQARARGVCLEYDIYGSGPLATALERCIGTLGLRGAARLCGPANQECLAEALRRSHVLLAPSATSRDGDEEGIPMVLMEASATELPVVATDCGGVAELVKNESSGLLVPECDSSAMADALCRLSSSAELARRLGRAGRLRVLEDFDERRQGQRLATLLRRLGSGG
jgi:colanic acid/amylovoran biosynthesis glycosyltransferase